MDIEKIKVALLLQYGSIDSIARDYQSMDDEYRKAAIDLIAFSNPYTAIMFAINYYEENRFEAGEPIIATNAVASMWYAKYVIGKRFELGEPIIATCPFNAYQYARDIIRGRWEPGEKAIATSERYSYQYSQGVLKKRFKLGEHTILNSIYAENYKMRYHL